MKYSHLFYREECHTMNDELATLGVCELRVDSARTVG
jgi:hypothetical protein